jgi:hypothetical protein
MVLTRDAESVPDIPIWHGTFEDIPPDTMFGNLACDPAF